MVIGLTSIADFLELCFGNSLLSGNLGTSIRSSRTLGELSLPVEGRMLSVADGVWQTLGLGRSLNPTYNAKKKDYRLKTMGMMEIVFNRPLDILRMLLESDSPRSVLEDFFRFGAGDAAAMCLMLAARILHSENLISNVLACHNLKVVMHHQTQVLLLDLAWATLFRKLRLFFFFRCT
ncbi:unnamed protein product [Sphenostylis stenocarpa]|uniref:Uncharacterized protein n=1 Tax=Sphenostylis stenocarpa TaxID=92480 RepID=A0AA86S6J7_9FABA|nr:unnamed protein product [Sphenostylis stenocarpa]